MIAMHRSLALLLLLGVSAAAAQSPGTSNVVVITDPLVPVAGLPLAVTVLIENPVEAARVFVRPIGSADAYTRIDGANPSGDQRTWTGTIPESHITLRGFEVYVEYVEDGVTITEPQVQPQANPMRFPVFVPRVRAGLVLPAFQYRMVSVPLQFAPQLGSTLGSFQDVFVDDYGPYNQNQWRVLRWDPSANDYLEGASALPTVRPGDGFWLITSSGSEFDVEGGVTAGFSFDPPGEQPVTILLAPGWNQIGNPFAFPLPWSSVEASGNVSAPYAFAGDYVPGQTVLQPWQGYFVENRTSGPVQLTFRAPVAGAAAADAAEAPFATRYLDELGPGGYLLQISADAGDSRDRHTYLGLTRQPAELDLAKAPSVGEGVRVYADADDRQWAGRIEVLEGAAAWTVAVTADGWRSARPVTLDLIEHGDRPPGTVLTVTDLGSGRAVRIDGGTFTTTLGAGASTRRYRFELLPEAEAALRPDDDLLTAIYPNPLRAGVETGVVRYWAPAAHEVRLEVYDVLGRRVALLATEAGADDWRTLRWDGRDHADRPLPAGTYVLRLRAGDAVATRRITLL